MLLSSILISFVFGLFTGIGLSIIAVITGKAYAHQVNTPYISTKKAQIITSRDPISEILNEN